MTMRYVLALALALAPYFSSYAQSASPACFACPPHDMGEFALGHFDVNADPIFCSYPVQGGDPNTHYCTYSRVNGHLVYDHDVGLCPANAVSTSCVHNRKRDALPKPLVKSRSRLTAENPQFIQMRNKKSLKKRAESLDDA